MTSRSADSITLSRRPRWKKSSAGLTLHRVACTIAICTIAVGANGNEPTSNKELCQPAQGDPRSVTDVIDAGTVRLDDNRLVRLAGIEPPHPPRPLENNANWPLLTTAKTELSALVSARTVFLVTEKPNRDFGRTDRYSRLNAQLFFVPTPGTNSQHTAVTTPTDNAPTVAPDAPSLSSSKPQWVQAVLVGKGLARATTFDISDTCFAHLQSLEAKARRLKLGLWQNPAYAIKAALHTKHLNTLQGTMQIVAGRIVKVGMTRKRIYLNFDNDWRTDFTAVVDRNTSGISRNWLNGLKRLEGRWVRIRGWLENRNGPSIVVSTARQIEVPEVAPDSSERLRPY